MDEKTVENKLERVGAPAKRRLRLTAQRKGFYAQHMKALELGDLEVALSTGLTDEIAMLRVLTRRLFEFASATKPEDVKEWAALVGALGIVSTRIATLLRTDKMLASGETNAVAAALAEALASIKEEFDL